MIEDFPTDARDASVAVPEESGRALALIIPHIEALTCGALFPAGCSIPIVSLATGDTNFFSSCVGIEWAELNTAMIITEGIAWAI